MSDNSFVVGDVVQLKSGGPKMTISGLFSEAEKAIYQLDCVCSWFVTNTSELSQDGFVFDELEYADKD